MSDVFKPAKEGAIMGQWEMARRQEFIAATFGQFGQIRRADIIREFGVTAAIASADISKFLAANPAMVVYDVSAKLYYLAESGELPSEGITEPEEASDGG